MPKQFMNQPDIKPQQDVTARHPSAFKQIAKRLRLPFMVLVATLLLEGGFYLALSWSDAGQHALPSVHAEANVPDVADHDEYIVRLGIVMTRPEGTTGTWVISDTYYIVTNTTEVDGNIIISDCVEVKVAESDPAIAIKIVEKDLGNCSQDDGGDSGDDEVIRQGRVLTRPEQSIGTWIISDTITGVEDFYTATEATQVFGEISVGECVQIEALESDPQVANKIFELGSWKCGDDDDGGDDDDEQEYLFLTAIVNDRPNYKVGTWTISNTQYTVNQETVIDGRIFEGDCVQVKSRTSNPTIAIKMVEKDASWCGGNGGGTQYREWEGTIVRFPLLLQGEWVIALGENQYITFTTKLDTSFDPNLPTDFAIGSWVEVKASRQEDGSFVAERIRLDDHEVGEIVVRLESSAVSLTLASKYNLLLMNTLLTQANIYLYVTNDENEQWLVWQLSREEGVIWAEVNYVNSVPEDDGYKTWGWGGADEPDSYLNQSAYQQIHMGQASRAYGGNGVVIAVLDTGIYVPHEQFNGHLQLPSLDIIDDDEDPSEVGPGLSWGHGTHVAGIIAAMAPNAKILPVRVLDENGRGNTFLLAYAIEWAARQPGVKVINLSLGTEYDSRILRDVIEKVVEQGIIVVAAAGNSNTNIVQYPAGYPNVVSVTAVSADSAKAPFANYGAGWVDVSAPGVGIMSTMINEDGPGYATWSGTSMATAFVSGAATLLSQKWSVESATTGGILDQLVNTGGLLDALNPGYAGQLGLLLDVSAALDVQPSILYLPISQK